MRDWHVNSPIFYWYNTRIAKLTNPSGDTIIVGQYFRASLRIWTILLRHLRFVRLPAYRSAHMTRTTIPLRAALFRSRKDLLIIFLTGIFSLLNVFFFSSKFRTWIQKVRVIQTPFQNRDWRNRKMRIVQTLFRYKYKQKQKVRVI